MNQRQQFCFFGVLFLGAMNFSDVASAQFAPDPFFYRKPHEIAPQKYRKQNDGTILERKTGYIYDRQGNLLRRDSTSTSQLTRQQIRAIAYDPEFRKRMQRNLCGTYTRPKVNGYRLSSYETALLREDLGC